MRSTFTGLNTMVRGIFANQLSLDTVGHNIVNASTEGYSRQSVNLVATRGTAQGSAYGEILVGTGVDSMSLTRARNIYADKQYRDETAYQEYYNIMQTNYERVEMIFNDADDTGIQNAMNEFYRSLVNLSANASGDSERRNVINKGIILTDMIQTAAAELQEQIQANYDEIEMRIGEVNELTEKIVLMNKNINAQEAGGAMANDLRDQRDLLVDQLAGYIDVNVTETSAGGYTITTNGATLVNGVTRLTIERTKGVASGTYGVNYGITDYNIQFAETNILFNPTNGAMKGNFDAIAEDKYFIDRLANISAFMMTTFNEQHKLGLDREGNAGMNFFGESTGEYVYDYNEMRYAVDEEMQYSYLTYTDENGNEKQITGMQIINALEVNSKLIAADGAKYVAASTPYVDEMTAKTARGDNAVLLSDYFNMDRQYTDNTRVNFTDKRYYLTDQNGDVVYTDSKYADTNGEKIFFTGANENKEIVYRGDIYNGGTGNEVDVVYKVANTDTDGTTTYSYVDGKGNEVIRDDTGATVTYTITDKEGNVTTYDTGLAASQGIIVYQNNNITIYRDSNGNYTDGTNTFTTKTHADDPDIPDGVIVFENDADNTETYNATPYATVRAMGDISINAYYNSTMTQLGIRSESMDVRVESQEDLMTQIANWRASEMGVDWNEELTNMIKFQKGFSACARCLSAMDEMLDRLVNNTGMVGR